MKGRGVLNDPRDLCEAGFDQIPVSIIFDVIRELYLIFCFVSNVIQVYLAIGITPAPNPFFFRSVSV